LIATESRISRKQMFALPVKQGWEEFGDQPFIVGSQLDGVTGFIAFAIQIVWVEGPYRGKVLLVFFVCKVRVCIFAVPSRSHVSVE
jgi:hypothetical protein